MKASRDQKEYERAEEAKGGERKLGKAAGHFARRSIAGATLARTEPTRLSRLPKPENQKNQIKRTRLIWANTKPTDRSDPTNSPL